MLHRLLVQVAGEVAGEDLGGRPRQGGVHIHLEIRVGIHQALLLDLPDKVQKLLGAAHGEGGDHQVAALGQGLVNDPGQVVGVVGLFLHVMQAVPVGALGDYIVRLGDGLGGADDGLLAVADVAGEHDFFGKALLGEPHLHTGGAQQVARVHKADFDAVGYVQLPAVLAGDNVAQGLFHVLQGVQRLHGRLAGPFALLVFIGGVVLLDLGGVPQHDGQQLGGEPGAVDIAREALLHQQGQAAGVVDVGVGDHHVVDVAGDEIKLTVVPLVPALLKAAVHQYLVPVDLHAVAAACDRLGRAEECKFHLKAPLLSMDDMYSFPNAIVYHRMENVKRSRVIFPQGERSGFGKSACLFPGGCGIL